MSQLTYDMVKLCKMEGDLESIAYKGKKLPQSLIDLIPQQGQAQDSLIEQLDRLIPFAVRLGEYDAADYLKNIVRKTEVKVKTEREDMP